MIVSIGIGNANADDDLVEKRGIAQRNPCAPEVLADVERQLVDARLETIARSDSLSSMRRMRWALVVTVRRSAYSWPTSRLTVSRSFC